MSRMLMAGSAAVTQILLLLLLVSVASATPILPALEKRRGGGGGSSTGGGRSKGGKSTTVAIVFVSVFGGLVAIGCIWDWWRKNGDKVRAKLGLEVKEEPEEENVEEEGGGTEMEETVETWESTGVEAKTVTGDDSETADTPLGYEEARKWAGKVMKTMMRLHV